jgi:predicted acylesterase/phospholipase RssA
VQESPRLRIDAPKARIQNPMPSEHFIGIALSGGGSRAANFSAASLEQLEQFGLVSGASAISGVSGGAIAGGYYAAWQADGLALASQQAENGFLRPDHPSRPT